MVAARHRLYQNSRLGVFAPEERLFVSVHPVQHAHQTLVCFQATEADGPCLEEANALQRRCPRPRVLAQLHCPAVGCDGLFPLAERLVRQTQADMAGGELGAVRACGAAGLLEPLEGLVGLASQEKIAAPGKVPCRHMLGTPAKRLSRLVQDAPRLRQPHLVHAKLCLLQLHGEDRMVKFPLPVDLDRLLETSPCSVVVAKLRGGRSEGAELVRLPELGAMPAEQRHRLLRIVHPLAAPAYGHGPHAQNAQGPSLRLPVAQLARRRQCFLEVLLRLVILPEVTGSETQVDAGERVTDPQLLVNVPCFFQEGDGRLIVTQVNHHTALIDKPKGTCGCLPTAQLIVDCDALVHVGRALLVPAQAEGNNPEVVQHPGLGLFVLDLAIDRQRVLKKLPSFREPPRLLELRPSSPKCPRLIFLEPQLPVDGDCLFAMLPRLIALGEAQFCAGQDPQCVGQVLLGWDLSAEGPSLLQAGLAFRLVAHPAQHPCQGAGGARFLPQQARLLVGRHCLPEQIRRLSVVIHLHCPRGHIHQGLCFPSGPVVLLGDCRGNLELLERLGVVLPFP